MKHTQGSARKGETSCRAQVTGQDLFHLQVFHRCSLSLRSFLAKTHRNHESLCEQEIKLNWELLYCRVSCWEHDSTFQMALQAMTIKQENGKKIKPALFRNGEESDI